MDPGAADQSPAWLRRQLPAAPLTAAERAAQMREVADILRAHDCAAAQHIAAAFERWLADGGDLACHIGIIARPGDAYEPLWGREQRKLRRDRDTAIRMAVKAHPGNQSARVRWLLAQLSRGGLPQLSIYQVDDSLPTSPSQLHRILRGA